MRRRWLSAAMALAAISTACSREAKYQEPVFENPFLSSGDVRITRQDGAKILSMSKSFASENGFSFETTNGPSGFTLLMLRRAMTIHVHNRIDPEMAKVRITDKEYMNSVNMELAQRYMDLVRGQSSAKRRGHEM